MPEGDTVWRTAQTLDKALRGATLLRTEFRVPQHATADLRGEVVTGSLSRGKHLLLRIGEQYTLHTHLKMEGSWHLYRPETRWRRPVDSARVVLGTPRWLAVGFSLGVVELINRGEEADLLAHLGPDLLGEDWDLDQALRNLLREPQRSVGEALLDQRNLAGIGNMYRAEALFVCGVHPYTAVGDVPDLARVVLRAQMMLAANKERPAQTTTGDMRPGHRHWVFDRAGQPCRRCERPVQREMLGEAGRERIAYFCAHCQPLLGHTDGSATPTKQAGGS